MEVIKKIQMADHKPGFGGMGPRGLGRFYDLEVRDNEDGFFEVVNLFGYLGTGRTPYSHPVVKHRGTDKAAALAYFDKQVAAKQVRDGYTVGQGE